MHRVLVLNATYEPLSIISVQRAIVLLLKEKAELIESAEERLHAAYTQPAGAPGHPTGLLRPHSPPGHPGADVAAA